MRGKLPESVTRRIRLFFSHSAVFAVVMVAALGQTTPEGFRFLTDAQFGKIAGTMGFKDAVAISAYALLALSLVRRLPLRTSLLRREDAFILLLPIWMGLAPRSSLAGFFVGAASIFAMWQVVDYLFDQVGIRAAFKQALLPGRHPEPQTPPAALPQAAD